MDEFDAATAAVEEIAAAVVVRHRDAGILTWALLHKMEDEVMSDAIAAGHDRFHVRMMRSVDELGYPKDDSPASFAGHEVVPVILSALERAWLSTH